MIDPDASDPRLVAQLVKYYEDSALKLREIVLNPPGSTDSAKEFNLSRAAGLLNQVQHEIDRLKHQASSWTGTAIEDAMQRGLAEGDRQAKAAGIQTHPFQGSFSLVDRRAIEVLAHDTIGDLNKAADSMRATAFRALHGMAATGVSKAEVNRILAGGIIEGKPVAAIQQLRIALEKVYGEKVTVPTKKGGEITFDAKYYARMVANTKTRSAVEQSRHIRLQERGLDLVKVIGKISLNPCTLLLGHVFSLSGKSEKYPSFDSVSHGQLPYKLFHPNCSKSTAPFVEGLSKISTRGDAQAEAA